MAQYLKQNSEKGFIEDYAEIEKLRFENLRHTILGCMLGDFDENGRYVVDPEITKELIAMRKYVIDTMDNIEICLSELKLDKQISFSVTFEGNCATLCLIEKLNYEGNFKINSGAYSNINEYVLDVIETSGVVDKNIVYKRWNISQFGGSALDVFNMDEETLAQYFALVNRFKYLMRANQILLEKEESIERVETEHIRDVLELITGYAKLNDIVKSQLKQELNVKKNIICIDRPNFAKTVNEVITQILDNNIGTLDDNERLEFDTAMHNINNNYDIKIRKLVDVKTDFVKHDNHEYNRYQLDTGGIEKSESLIDVANTFIKAQQTAKLRARANAERIFKRSDNKEVLSEDLISVEMLKNALQRQIGYDISGNVAIPIIVPAPEIIAKDLDSNAPKEKIASSTTNTKGTPSEDKKAPSKDKKSPSKDKKASSKDKKSSSKGKKAPSKDKKASSNAKEGANEKPMNTQTSNTYSRHEDNRPLIQRKLDSHMTPVINKNIKPGNINSVSTNEVDIETMNKVMGKETAELGVNGSKVQTNVASTSVTVISTMVNSVETDNLNTL